MKQLPIFMNLSGRKVVLVGTGEAANAKKQLIERAGGTIIDDCTAAICSCARIAFVAIENESEAMAKANLLRTKGLLVNVVDHPDHCDFTTPAIVDRDPVLIAVGTGGASAGMAKAIRQRIEAMLPQGLGALALSVGEARDAIRARWPAASERRRALDAALLPGGALDPPQDADADTVANWLGSDQNDGARGLINIALLSDDPDELTLRAARLLGQADHIFHDAQVPDAILNRARADAVRHLGTPPATLPDGLILRLIARA